MEATASALLPDSGIDRLSYDRSLFPWRYALCAAMGDWQPETLHRFGGLTSGGDEHHRRLQGTIWHRNYYVRFMELVRPLYLQFLGWLAAAHNIREGQLVYQKVPTLRVHRPGDLAVGEWHRDRDYGHAVGEVNFWLPITNAFGTSSVWIEGDQQDLTYGQILIFDGVNLLHGNKLNLTTKTRVSIDFRLALRSQFNPSGAETVCAGKRMEIGDCYFEVM